MAHNFTIPKPEYLQWTKDIVLTTDLPYVYFQNFPEWNLKVYYP